MEDCHCDIEKTLNEEFFQVLRIIKSHIERINNCHYLSLCQQWLEKLSSGISWNQKEERNRYLVELCNQIQDGELEFPYSQPPPEGQLPPFPYNSTSCNQLQTEETDKVTFQSTNCGDTRILKVEGHISLPSTPRQTVCTLDISETNSQDDIEKEPDKTDVEIPDLTVIGNSKILKQSKLKFEYRIEHKGGINKRSGRRKCTLKKKNKNNVFSNDNSKNTLETKLGEPSSEVLFKPKESESLVSELGDISTDSKNTDSSKSQSSQCVCKNSSASVPCDVCHKTQSNLENGNNKVDVNCLKTEIRVLKDRLQDLYKIKEILQSNNKFNEYHKRWTTTLNNLNNQLQSSEKKNSELRMQIQSMNDKLTTFKSLEKLEQCQCQKQHLSVEYLRQMHMLQSHYKEHLQSLEEKFTQILNEKEHSFGEKLASLRETYEQRIVELGNDCAETMRDKETQITRLETSLEDLCQKMHEEVSKIKTQIEESNLDNSQVDAVAFLKDCIWKMDQLYKETEKKYNNKIRKLKEKLYLKDKTTKLQMVAQKAEIVNRVTSKSRTQMDNTLIQLEERYKEILENQRMQFLMEQQQDRKLISELRRSLENNLRCR